jgi:hypothetical protein
MPKFYSSGAKALLNPRTLCRSLSSDPLKPEFFRNLLVRGARSCEDESSEDESSQDESSEVQVRRENRRLFLKGVLKKRNKGPIVRVHRPLIVI